MKQSGLRNRFPEEVRYVWLYWYSCMVCSMNQIDALHHIISPSVRQYVDGKHNTSVFNSCPIHNFKCHIGNEAWLGQNLEYLLNKVARALIFDIGYTLKPVDIDFIRVYQKLFDSDIIKVLSINHKNLMSDENTEVEVSEDGATLEPTAEAQAEADAIADGDEVVAPEPEPEAE